MPKIVICTFESGQGDTDVIQPGTLRKVYFNMKWISKSNIADSVSYLWNYIETTSGRHENQHNSVINILQHPDRHRSWTSYGYLYRYIVTCQNETVSNSGRRRSNGNERTSRVENIVPKLEIDIMHRLESISMHTSLHHRSGWHLNDLIINYVHLSLQRHNSGPWTSGEVLVTPKYTDEHALKFMSQPSSSRCRLECGSSQ